MDAPDKLVTAALIIIGNEILSGRTKDVNLNHIALKLTDHGIRMMECRVVPDVEDEIITAINGLRAKFDYVFTTGGIGPTHDDITAACVAKAFGRKLICNPDAYEIMAAHYKILNVEFTTARARMANTPEGASLIENPVSVAPGFQVENVFVMAGVPKIMQAMLTSLLPSLVGGAKMLSATLMCNLPEGDVAAGLGAIQQACMDVEIGSYPAFASSDFRLSLVLRATDQSLLDAAITQTIGLIEELGGTYQRK